MDSPTKYIITKQDHNDITCPHFHSSHVNLFTDVFIEKIAPYLVGSFKNHTARTLFANFIRIAHSRILLLAIYLGRKYSFEESNLFWVCLYLKSKYDSSHNRLVLLTQVPNPNCHRKAILSSPCTFFKYKMSCLAFFPSCYK